MDRFIRILTTGKPLGLINQGIVDAIHGGSRVLVKVGTVFARFSETTATSELGDENTIGGEKMLDSENQAIAVWAENLSQDEGLVWQRLGPDVVFTKNIAGSLNRSLSRK